MYRNYKGLGRVWLPESYISMPGKPATREHYGVVVAAQTRLKGFDEIKPLVPEIEHPYKNQGMDELNKWRPEFAPEKFVAETVWGSVTHNERTDSGASITINRLFGTLGTANAGPFVNIGVGGTAGAAPSFAAVITKTKTDKSLGILAQGVTTNEATTVGLARLTTAPSTPDTLGSAPAALDGNQTLNIPEDFTLTGTAVIFAAGLFDHATAASSNLYCEDNFSSSATLANTDHLVVTWTLSQ